MLTKYGAGLVPEQTFSRQFSDPQATILSFPQMSQRRNHFTTRDRMEALRWADDAEAHGYTRIVFDTACERSGHEAGDFILIYARNAMWASWGIASSEGELTLWRASNGVTVGTFSTMQQTLQAVMRAPL